MTFLQRKILVLTAWAVSVVAFGLIFAIDKPNVWVLVSSLIIIPVMIGNRLWVEPEPTLAQLIAKGRARR